MGEQAHTLDHPDGVTCVFSDASWQNGKAGVAGIAQNGQQPFLSSWVGKRLAFSPLHAEAIALLTSIQIAAAKDWKPVKFLSDSLTLIEAVNNNEPILWEIKNIVLDIQRYLRGFDHWECYWISRDLNSAADVLARVGRTGHAEGLILFDGEDQSPFVSSVVALYPEPSIASTSLSGFG